MHIATFMQDLAGGGAERVAVLLMNGLADHHRVSLILARREGPYLDDLDPRITVHDLGGRKTLSSIMPLRKWLIAERPDVILSHLTHVNVAVGLANQLGPNVPHVAVEHNQMGLNFQRMKQSSVRIAYRMARFIYPRAARIVSVSDGVGESVRAFTGMSGENFQTIHNPVVTPALLEQAASQPSHRWLADHHTPVIIGCGRLVEQKDFATLIKAFGLVRESRPARLVIMGDGDERGPLKALAEREGLSAYVDLPGFLRNPFSEMAAADMFVLSSRWEGLPTVLIEALATGANIVSTDCPSGPDEVLEHGRYGRLVPVGDQVALAAAMIDALDNPMRKEQSRQRAMDYSLERAVARYEELFETLTRKGGQTSA